MTLNLFQQQKIETRHPVKTYFGREFAAICYHCRVMAAWSRQKLKILKKFLRFLEKRLLMIKFSKLCSESLHRDTDRRCCVHENSWKLSDGEIDEIVRCLPDEKKISAPSQTVATARIAPKVCHGQPPTFGSQHSKFHSNRFTFGVVIAGRMKAVAWALCVSPILAQSDTSFSVNNK